MALANIGRVEEEKGNYALAGEYFNHAHKVLVGSNQTDSSLEAKIEVYQALLATDQGETAEAIRQAYLALALLRTLKDSENPDVASGLLALGQAKLLGGDAAGAESAFREALTIRQRLYPPSHPEVLQVNARLIEALLAEGRSKDSLTQAEGAFKQALDAPYPLPKWRIAELKILKAMALSATGHTAESSALISEGRNELVDYNQPAMRRYLMERLRSRS